MSENERTSIGDDIEAELAAAPEPRKPRAKTTSSKKTGKKADYIDIMLEENDDIPPTGLFIGINGRSYLLQPGMKAAVPPGVVDVLDNAIMATPRIDPQTKRVVGYKDRLRYPYRRL